MKLRLLNEKNVRAVSPALPEIVGLVEQAYRLDAEGKAEVPTKIGVHPERPNTFLHAMPAWVGGSPASLGMKWVSYFPGNFDRGLPDSTGIIILNDPEIGLPCCIMEGMYVTFIRTAACAAVAAKFLAPWPPKTLGPDRLRRARSLVAAYDGARPFHRSNGFSFRRGRAAPARSFARRCRRKENGRSRPVDDPLQAVRNMDIVVTSIPPGDDKPVTAEALAPGGAPHSARSGELVAGRCAGLADRVVADNPANFAAQI